MRSPSAGMLEEETLGDVTTARLNVEALSEWNVEEVRVQLLDLASRCEERQLHLDLGRMEYLTSSGLGAFLVLNKKVRAGGGRLRLDNVSPGLYELFALTRLTTVLDVRQQGSEGATSMASSA
jgi:anti-sigma B factor antagonist